MGSAPLSHGVEGERHVGPPAADLPEPSLTTVAAALAVVLGTLALVLGTLTLALRSAPAVGRWGAPCGGRPAIHADGSRPGSFLLRPPTCEHHGEPWLRSFGGGHER